MFNQNLADLVRQPPHCLIVDLLWDECIFVLALACNLISLAINVPGIAGFDLQLLYNSGIRHTFFV